MTKRYTIRYEVHKACWQLWGPVGSNKGLIEEFETKEAAVLGLQKEKRFVQLCRAGDRMNNRVANSATKLDQGIKKFERFMDTLIEDFYDYEQSACNERQKKACERLTASIERRINETLKHMRRMRRRSDWPRVPRH